MVYDAKTMTLVKEGDGGLSISEIQWKIDESGKSTQIYLDYYNAAFELPQSWLDQLRAKLP
jgi:hypothetical protein